MQNTSPSLRLRDPRCTSVALAAALLATFALDASPARADSPPVAEAKPEAAPEAKADNDPVAKADALMVKRGRKNLKEAASLYKKALAAKPGDIDLMLKAADALNGLIRATTDGNSVLVDGTSDTPKNKKIFGTLGKESLELAEVAIKARPNNLRAHAVYTDAYIYASSEYGLIKAALTGAADIYKDNAKKLTKLNRKFDGGLGYMLMAAFYVGAPWPMSDSGLAVEYMEKALKVKSKSRRNQYYMGVSLFRDGQFKRAIPYFEAVPTSPCPSASERDMCAFLKRESVRALKLTKKEAE